MPIWSELAVLLLLTYGLGLGTGWVLWGRAVAIPDEATNTENAQGETSA